MSSLSGKWKKKTKKKEKKKKKLNRAAVPHDFYLIFFTDGCKNIWKIVTLIFSPKSYRLIHETYYVVM